MKKLFVLLAIFSFALSGKAANEGDYAIIDGKAYFCVYVKRVFKKIRLHTEDGPDIRVPLSKVDAYCVDGRVFHYLPLTSKNGEVKRSAFLELIAYRNGLSLYRYCSMDNSLGCCFEDNQGRVGVYFVYNTNDEFHLSVDERNVRTVLPFFGIKTI